MKNRLTLYILLLTLLCSCSQNDGLKLPKNKVWAHKVNTLDDIRAKEDLFEGMELDIIYSPYQDKLFVCHNEEDTIKNITLDKWFDAFKKPKKHCFWLDIKGLTTDNCDVIVSHITRELKKHHIENRAFIESSKPQTLKRAKELGLHTSLWVPNFWWTDIDTISWLDKVQRDCDTCQPDALSCEWRMYDALTTFFPERNIFLWHTGDFGYTPENEEVTRMMCRNKSVKIVLVDYDKPCAY